MSASRPVTGLFFSLQDPLGLVLESCLFLTLGYKKFSRGFFEVVEKLCLG